MECTEGSGSECCRVGVGRKGGEQGGRLGDFAESIVGSVECGIRVDVDEGGGGRIGVYGEGNTSHGHNRITST